MIKGVSWIAPSVFWCEDRGGQRWAEVGGGGGGRGREFDERGAEEQKRRRLMGRVAVK